MKDKKLELIPQVEAKTSSFSKPSFSKPSFSKPSFSKPSFSKPAYKNKSSSDVKPQKSQQLQVPNYLPMPVSSGQNMYYYHPGSTNLKNLL